MKIHYWSDTSKCPNGNFGDMLNLWLWPKLIPDIICDTDNSKLVGIGTLLNETLPTNQPLAILGSGVGYGRTPQLMDKWHVYCVRGPRTASALELDPKLAITDAALLIRSCYKSRIVGSNSKEQIAFMPHWQTPIFPWKQACEKLGMMYIDPGEPVEQVLFKISRAKYVLAEAMHGAIVADTLRVPWVAVSTRQSVNTFKWSDWCESLQVEYNPVKLYWKRFTPNLVSQNHSLAHLAQIVACKSLRRLSQSAKPRLSEEKILFRKEEMLLEKLDLLRNDWDNGMFF